VAYRRHPERNIVLTGFHGCRLHEIGRELALRLRRPFFDVPVEVERRMRHNLLVRAGIGKAPRRERMVEWVVRDLSYRRSTVAVLDCDAMAHPDGYEELQIFSFLVYLDPPFESLWDRLQREPACNDLLLQHGPDGLREMWEKHRRNIFFCNLQVFLPVDEVAFATKLIAHCFYT